MNILKSAVIFAALTFGVPAIANAGACVTPPQVVSEIAQSVKDNPNPAIRELAKNLTIVDTLNASEAAKLAEITGWPWGTDNIAHAYIIGGEGFDQYAILMANSHNCLLGVGGMVASDVKHVMFGNIPARVWDQIALKLGHRKA